MNKINDYFYIFSKLTTSIVLIIIIISMGYTLYLSYEKADNSNVILDNKFNDFEELLKNNDNIILSLNSKILLSEKKIQGILKKLNEQDNLNYQKEIENLKGDIIILQNDISKFRTAPSNLNENIISKKNNQYSEINKLKKLLLMKYKKGDIIDDELFLLESFSKNKNKNVFDKLAILNLNKFHGIKNLNDSFDIYLSKYINEVFEKKNKNFVINFLLNFVSIRPSNLNVYENDYLNKLMNAKRFILAENYNQALKLITSIDQNQKFFGKWIKQIKIYLEFENLILEIQ